MIPTDPILHPLTSGLTTGHACRLPDFSLIVYEMLHSAATVKSTFIQLSPATKPGFASRDATHCR